MFATIVVCGLIAGSSRAHYMFGAGQGGYGLQLYGCGAGAGWTCWTCYLDRSQGGDGLPALGCGAGSVWKGEPAQTSLLHWSWSREGPAQCYSCKCYGHFPRKCPSNGQYRIWPNGLPVRVGDPSRDSSQESCLAKQKTPPSNTLN